MSPPTFLGEPNAEDAAVAILPVPFERTTSYGRGTDDGPAAILEASQYVELYDEELRCEPHAVGVRTLPPLAPEGELEEAMRQIESGIAAAQRDCELLVTLGGEHSITGPAVRALARRYSGSLGVVQFDAHADLRQSYEGSPHSHACVMRRIVDLGLPILALGIRSLSSPEAALIEERKLPTVWASELAKFGPEHLEAALAPLPEEIYLTFDVDYFDPALLPATGTPEPGGGTWYPTLALLRRLFERKTVRAIDVVELAPQPVHRSSDFLVAKLVHKCIGYWALANGRVEAPAAG